jgi:hypothetical protein
LGGNVSSLSGVVGQDSPAWSVGIPVVYAASHPDVDGDVRVHPSTKFAQVFAIEAVNASSTELFGLFVRMGMRERIGQSVAAIKPADRG